MGTRLSAVVTAVFVLAACSDEPVRPPSPSEEATVRPPNAAALIDPVVVAAGDIACGGDTPAGTACKQLETSDVVLGINPDAVLILGDNQYESGQYSYYQSFYGPTWGRFKARTFPAPGNHEYQTAGAAGYFDYFNGVGVQIGAAGDRSKGYYSFNLGSWHVVSLNSNCSAVGGCGAGSPQEQWLRADLAANPATCTLAYWHHPRFSSGAHGSDATYQAFWQALYDHDADLVLVGHDHEYERFAPQTASGALDITRGIRSFVVGNGGKSLRAFGTIRPHSDYRNSVAFGVLRLTLRASSFDWQAVPIPGDTLSDAGSAACHQSAPPPPPPPTTTLTFSPAADAYVASSTPGTNFGTATIVTADKKPALRSFIKFNVTGVGSSQIASAVLKVFSVDASNSGGRFHRVTSTAWGETTITWSNQPAYTSSSFATLGAIATQRWYEVNVASQVTGDGVYSFALTSTSNDGADYTSREGANKPQLVITLR